ncbi:MAG: ABC transporter permease [Bacteroides sp.]|nr:ABC transporter permease [Eubacterium sp.]MCM1418633.1 ABC transporter permease [Roseburia sp.]MCM1462687.1 ABC transporter permease [Bacteroides sp.]
MKKLFYFRLAAVNMKKNARVYLPYLLTCMLTIAMYYIMKSLSLNEGLDAVMGGNVVSVTLMLGSNVIAVFAFIFLFYTNSFLMKNRKKEFGLYQILGMEKRHLSRLIACESLYTAILSFIGGLGAGLLLDKLMYLTIAKIVRVEVTLDYYISADAIRYTLILFTILFVLILLNSLRAVSFVKPIELLRGGSVGEKEPKIKWISALLGVAFLGGGYTLALRIENPVDALALFFVAVLLVIGGTYLLFMAGSIALLKLLKKNRRYYYKPNHFIGVSGMIYRMKQNAVGLANICILSTMVLVMVSSTSALMIGVEDILLQRYPYEITMVSHARTEEGRALAEELIREGVKAEGINVLNESSYTSLEFTAVYREGDGEFIVKAPGSIISDQYGIIYAITAEDYEKNTGRATSLAENEVLLYTNRSEFRGDTLRLFDEDYRVVEKTDAYVLDGELSAYMVPVYGLVVKDRATLEKLDLLQKEVYEESASSLTYRYQFDTELTAEEQIRLNDRLFDYFNERRAALGEEAPYALGSYRLTSREAERSELYGLYGSFFFLGIFLGLLFIMATVLIIYYKQISEGYDDQERFEIMQKVGMSAREVKGTIRSQVLTVFFLPLLTAGVHVLFAFPMIARILTLFQLTNTSLYILCTVGCFLIFTLIYGLIYSFTARAYYRIVRR